MVSGLHLRDGVEADPLVCAVQSLVINTKPAGGGDTEPGQIVADIGGARDPDAGARERARDRLLHHYLSRAAEADKDLRSVPAELSRRAQALALLDAERPNFVAAVTMAAREGRNQVACDLPLYLGQYFYWRRYLIDWVRT